MLLGGDGLFNVSQARQRSQDHESVDRYGVGAGASAMKDARLDALH